MPFLLSSISGNLINHLVQNNSNYVPIRTKLDATFSIGYSTVAGGDTTPVSNSKTHKYNILQKITTSKTHKYNILSTVSKSKTHKWNILQVISRTRTHKYDILQGISRTRTHIFNVLQQITTTKTHKWNMAKFPGCFLGFRYLAY